MINIKRNKCLVEVNISIPTPDAGMYSYTLTWNCGEKHEDYASFMVGAMNDHLGKTLACIRERAYQDGWRDAKAKRGKSTWFSRWWT